MPLNLESLNSQLKANTLMYGPDPSFSNRATIGGLIGNNSTGAHSIRFSAPRMRSCDASHRA